MAARNLARLAPLWVLLLAPRAVVEARLVCNGFEEDWGLCEGLPDCESCVPTNCAFGPWVDWYEAGGCSRIKFRHRSIVVENNECGTPCSGPKIMSAQSPNPDCELSAQDCVISPWEDWSACTAGVKQSYRTRNVLHEPANGGQSCAGSLKETKFCEASLPVPKPCLLSEWHDWTGCSVTCGIGQHDRMRRIISDRLEGGPECKDTMQEVASCVMPACPSQDCLLDEWGPWSACDVGASQMYRSRVVKTPSIGDGAACVGDQRETQPCPQKKSTPCSLASWSDWTECDKDCDGGQQFRTRSVLTDADGSCHWDPSLISGGRVPLHDTKECNAQPCDASIDCVLSDWSTWSDCSADCGHGTVFRHRIVAQPATGTGHGCDGATQETGGCTGTKCASLDCEWGEWYDWSACSATCGLGSHRRSRVVVQAPRLGGKLCEPADKSEVAECQIKPCDSSCVDAVWADWSAWTPCSATCGEGYQERSRDIATEANSCGNPVDGLKKEFQKCAAAAPCIADRDCVVGEWHEWSYCSCTCDGVRERTRSVDVFASGKGKPCMDTALRQMEACNPALGEAKPEGCKSDQDVDCALSEWTPFSTCSRTCGGGQRSKSRVITVYPKGTGKPCTGDLELTEGCQTQTCDPVECIDCAYSAWSAWGGCTHCGGQRYRSRHVATLPTACGKPCRQEALREVSNCTSPCVQLLTCAWSEWSDAAGCEAGCGGASIRTRTMGFLKTLVPGAVEEKGATDFDEELEEVEADDAAADVRFLADGGKKPKPKRKAKPWHKKKIRSTKKAFSPVHFEDRLFDAPEEALCSGTQMYTHSCTNPGCSKQCTPQDCVFGIWGAWSAPDCTGLCSRVRSIATHANECGQQCDGPTQETKTCKITCDKPVDCVLSDWSAWGTCATPDGQKTRTRSIEVETKNDGKPCEGHLEETMPCMEPPMKNCVFSAWGPFGACSAKCGGGFQTRQRTVADRAIGKGKACEGNMEELLPCNTEDCTPIPAKPCTFSDWSAWTPCSNGAQRSRERNIVAFAEGGGAPCTEALKQVDSCASELKNCEMGDWTAWDICDRSCGGGQQKRHRQVLVFPRLGGQECPSELHESQGCNDLPCPVEDCTFDTWSDWGVCSSSCGMGQKTRTRNIAGIRDAAGAGCEGSMHETVECLIAACTVTDCAWQDWHPWSDCSCTCDGGTRNRFRLVAVMPSPGGKACEPLDKEAVEPCNTQPCDVNAPIDGAWGIWSDWSPCSASCKSGTQFRQRSVAVMAENGGTPAEGDSKESRFCNEEISCSTSVNCEFGTWSDWSGCTNECNGVKRRHRAIAVYGQGEGTFCDGHLKQVFPCPDPGTPLPPQCLPPTKVDCVMSQWAVWSTCSATCGTGQHERSRSIQVQASGGGKACEESVGEVAECKAVPCYKPPAINCKVGAWGPWSICDKCAGQTRRYRHIITHAENGGTPCVDSDMEDTKGCPVTCGDADMVCAWQDWGSWGQCTSHCGSGKKLRTRKLALQHAPAHWPENVETFEVVHIKSFHHNHMCVSVPEGTVYNGANIHLWRCSDRKKDSGMAYDFLVSGSGHGSIRLAKDPSMCLSISEGKTHDDTNVQVWDCKDGHHKAFRFKYPRPGESGHIQVLHNKSACVSIDDGKSMSDGTNVQVWRCSDRQYGGRAFEFILDPVPSEVLKRGSPSQEYEQLQLRSTALQGSNGQELTVAFVGGMLFVTAALVAVRALPARRARPERPASTLGAAAAPSQYASLAASEGSTEMRLVE